MYSRVKWDEMKIKNGDNIHFSVYIFLFRVVLLCVSVYEARLPNVCTANHNNFVCFGHCLRVYLLENRAASFPFFVFSFALPFSSPFFRYIVFPLFYYTFSYMKKAFPLTNSGNLFGEENNNKEYAIVFNLVSFL